MLPLVTPVRLLRIPEAFDHPDVLFELKYDGFRGVAYVDGHRCQLVSRHGNVFKSWPYLCEEVAHALRCREALIDGEIVCLAADGRPKFRRLLHRREWPYYLAFDLLWVDGEDLRSWPLFNGSGACAASCRASSRAFGSWITSG